MTLTQQFITIGVCVLGTMLTRFLPFLLFGSNRPRRNMCNIWAGCCRGQSSPCW